MYLLNPAVLIAGPMWGQIDAAGTLVFMLTLLALAAGRWAGSGALAVLSGMTKPQFGLVVLPVAVVALRRWSAGDGIRPLLLAAAGGLLTYAVIAAPLLLDPLRYADQLYENASNRPFVSLYALNPWGLLVGFEVPDDGLVTVGVVLLVAGLLASMIPLWRRQDLPTLLAVGALVAFAFYFLPTRAHERYLFPAMALLAPFAVLSLRFLTAYVVLSLAFAASLLHALAYASPGSLAPELVELMSSSAAPWVIGVPLIASAIVLTWLLVRRAGMPTSA